LTVSDANFISSHALIERRQEEKEEAGLKEVILQIHLSKHR
jgi:hypothetical protein